MCTATAARATSIEPLAVSSRAGEAARQSGISTGTSIRPAPWALAIRNDQAARPSMPVCMPKRVRWREPYSWCQSAQPISRLPANLRTIAGIDHEAECHHGERHQRDRERMAERDRHQRFQHDRPALPVQPERDGEQPAHGRIDAVVRAEPGERQPRPPRGRHDLLPDAFAL